MRVCISCSKKLEKKHVRCRKCKYLVCHDCAVDDYCSSCHPANQDKAVIEEYFNDKYATPPTVGKTVAALMIFLHALLLLSFIPAVDAYNMTANVFGCYNTTGTAGLLDYFGVNDLTEEGTVALHAGVINSSRGVYSNSDRFYKNSPNFLFSTSVSMSFWIYAPGSINSVNHFISTFQGYDLDVYAAQSPNRIVFDCGNAAPTFTVNLTSATWHHIAVVHNATDRNCSLYVNGTLVNSSTASDSESGTGTFSVGDYYSGTGGQPSDDVYISELVVWNGTALSPDVVSALFNDGGGVTCSDLDDFGSVPEENVTEENVTEPLECNMTMIVPCDQCRYRDNVLLASWNCSNASASASDCFFTINGFAPEYPVNCTSFNFTAERGKNEFNLSVFNSTGSMTGTVRVTFFAKDDDASILSYTVLLVMIALYITCLVVGLWSGYGFFYALGVLPGLLLGFELYAISWVVGVLFWGFVMGLSTVLILSKWK